MHLTRVTVSETFSGAIQKKGVGRTQITVLYPRFYDGCTLSFGGATQSVAKPYLSDLGRLVRPGSLS
jgi:hypothetical protein